MKSPDQGLDDIQQWWCRWHWPSKKREEKK